MKNRAGTGRSGRRADDALERAMAQAGTGGTGLLPSISELSRRAGVSYKTMHRAVGRALTQGTIRRRSGSRLWLADSQAVANETPVVGAHRRIASVIRDRIARGIYPPGAPLPSLKQLSHNPGGNYRTVRKAVEALCDQGYCAHHGSRYFVVEQQASPAFMRVMLIRTIRRAHGSPETSPRRAHMLHTLQDEAYRRRLVLEEAHYDPVGGRLHQLGAGPQHRATNANREQLLGVVVWTAGFTTNALERLLSAVRTWGRPALLIDESWRFVSLLSTAEPPVGVVCLGDTLSEGVTVAQYLLGKGHRHIACIYPEYNTTGPNFRVEGLQSTIARAGPDTSFSLLHGFVTARGKRSEFRQAMRDLARQTEPVLRRALRASHGPMGVKVRRLIDETITDLHTVSGNLVRKLLVEDLCGRIVSHGTISAIVAFNDDYALSALHYLRTRGVQVPGDMALLGFDDSESSYVGSISSYHYNIAEAAHDIYNFLLTAGTSRFDRERYGVPIEVRGHVVERSST